MLEKKKRGKWLAAFLMLLLVTGVMMWTPKTSKAADDPDDLGEYTSAAQNGRTVIFNLVDADNQIAESYNIKAVAAESGVPGTDPHIPVSFNVTSSGRTSSTSHFGFSVTPGTYRTKLDKNGLYTILDLTCTMTVPHHLRQSGVGDENLPAWITDSSYVDNYPGGRYGAYDYNKNGCVGYAVFQLPRTPDGADRGNYTFHMQINIGNFRMNERTSSNDIAKKTYQFRYNKCAFLLNMGNCSVNEASGYSRGNGYLTHIATGTQVFIKNFDGVPNVFAVPETFGIYKPGYAFNCWQSTTNSSKTYKADGVTSYALEEFSDHATSTVNVVNVNDDNPGQGWAGMNPNYTILQELQAVWNIVNYNITYDLQGGTDPQNPVVYNVETATFTLKNPTREGYDFTGWSGTGLSGEGNMTVTIPKGSTGNRSYTAHWDKIYKYYTLTFDLNEGTIADNAPNTVKTASLANKVQEGEKWNTDENISVHLTKTPDYITKTGYEFTGWYFADGTKFTGEESATADTTVHAEWKPIEYPILYNLQGGNDPENPEKYTIETPTFTLKNPTRRGYDFIGWTGSNGSTPATDVKITKGSTGKKEYTAQWKPIEYPIVYDLQGGDDPENPEKYTIETPTFTLKKPTKKGYEFTGWTGSNGDTPETEVTIVKGSTGDREYTAHWKAVDYTIVYHLQGGTDPHNPSVYTIETPDFTLKNPTKEGYAFLGWTGSNGSAKETLVSIQRGTTGNLEFTAHWTAVEYKIEYDLQGGTDPHNPTGYNPETPDFTLNNPTKPGYEFTGWTGSNGDIPDTKVTIQKGSTGDKYFKANFMPKNYKITYDLDGGKDPKNPTKYNIETPNFTLKNPTRKGYIFRGWKGTGLKEQSKKVTVKKGSSGNRYYQAVWEPKLYKMPYLKTTKYINKGSKFRFIVYGAPKGYKKVWKNSNPKVISLSKNGVAKGKKNGTAVVGYKLYNKKNQLVYGFQIKVRVITTEFQTLNTSKKITVKSPTFMFDKTLCIGKKFKLGFRNLEKGAKVTYQSSNPKILSVSKKGVAKSKKKGFAYVTITLKQQNLTYRYRVHFKCEHIEF